MSSQIEDVPSLQLTLDHGRHRVTRESYPPVYLGGNCRQWRLLEELCRRYDAYYPKNELIATVWNDLGTVSIEEVTLYAAMSELRGRLRPLDLDIRHVKGLGYGLEDLNKR